MPAKTPDARLGGLTRVSVRDARRDFADLLNRAAYGVERIVIVRHGRPVAALVCVEDLHALEADDDALDRSLVAEIAGEKATAPRAAAAGRGPSTGRSARPVPAGRPRARRRKA